MPLPLIFVATIIIGSNTVAQQIKVISALDNSPLPYATVTNHTHPFIVSSDRNGLANLRASIGDSISISYVGYKTALLVFKGDKIQVVHLFQDQKTLPVVTVYNCRNAKEYNYDNFKDGKGTNKVDEFGRTYSGVGLRKGTNPNVHFAVRLNPVKPNAILKDFTFWLEKEWQAPGWSIRNPFLISFYEVSDSTNLPGELISDAPMLYFPKRAGKQTITFDSIQLRIPSNGIYISFQCIMNEEYEWKEAVRWRDRGQKTARDTVIIRYGGLIKAIRCKDFELAWYNGINNEWNSERNWIVRNDNMYITIKCEATIKFCNGE